LHYAAKSGHFSIVKSLVEAGSDIGATDRYKWKPLNYALGKGPARNQDSRVNMVDVDRRVDAKLVHYLTMLTNSVNYLENLTNPDYQPRRQRESLHTRRID